MIVGRFNNDNTVETNKLIEFRPETLNPYVYYKFDENYWSGSAGEIINYGYRSNGNLTPVGVSEGYLSNPIGVVGRSLYNNGLFPTGNTAYTVTQGTGIIPSEDSNSAMTFCFWINSKVKSGNQTIYSTASQSADVGFLWAYRTANTNNLTIQVCTELTGVTGNSGFTSIFNAATGLFTNLSGIWFHVTLIIDYKNKIYKTYRNGTFFQSGGTSPYRDRWIYPCENRTTGQRVARSLFINSYSAALHKMTDAYLDEVIIFTRELTEYEINKIYNHKINGFKLSGETGIFYSSNFTEKTNKISIDRYNVSAVTFKEKLTL